MARSPLDRSPVPKGRARGGLDPRPRLAGVAPHARAPKGPKRASPDPVPPPPHRPGPTLPRQAEGRGRSAHGLPASRRCVPTPTASGDLSLGVAVSADTPGAGRSPPGRPAASATWRMDVDPDVVGIQAALQHLAKAINIAFQTDYGENYLEAVYQAAIVRNGEIHIIHREYFGFRETWFGQLGMLLRSMQLTLEGPDPASPEGQKRIAEKGPATIRGLFNLLGRKLDLVAEFEDRVPAYVEQMFDRLEASGIIVGWDRDDWEIWTTTIGLDIRISPEAQGGARPRAFESWRRGRTRRDGPQASIAVKSCDVVERSAGFGHGLREGRPGCRS